MVSGDGLVVALMLVMWADLRFLMWKMNDRLDRHLDGGDKHLDGEFEKHGERRKAHV